MNAPAIGIDFGTSTSSMAWVDPRTGKAEVIKNAEGEEKTPSVVYFGANDVLVGTPAEQMLEDEEERKRVVLSVKRELINAPTLALPGRRVKAVEVAAEVFRKLRRDAEELHFHAPVERAVVTCPAAFGPLERDEIERAARLAGFAAIETLEEPVAAAIAYSREGLGVGRHILVYDLGGGTFDLALLREESGTFELAMEPKGLLRCGGDDFDMALYEYCEEEAERQWDEPLYPAGRDLKFLRECRLRKENLSASEQVKFSSLIGAGRIFQHALTRGLFEGLIINRVEATVRLTDELVHGAEVTGCPIDTVVLIGGSSRIPLIQRRLLEALPLEPTKWQHQDVAVALGAAYCAFEYLHPHPVPAPIPPNDIAAIASSEAAAPPLVPFTTFSDCLSDKTPGPTLVLIPAGDFLMGSPAAEKERFSDESPQHPVNVSAFAIGRCAVTFDEYDRFAVATRRTLPHDEGWGRGNRPVINVSWQDATAYCRWLSEQTGQSYRLPSESEWEYAARADSTTPFWTGYCIDTQQANYNGNSDYGAHPGTWLKADIAGCGAKTGVFLRQTMPVGSFPGNHWGLCEVAGNVWEWVGDHWHDGYLNAPGDGLPWCVSAPQHSDQRVVRGGSWLNGPGSLRSAKRLRCPATAGDRAVGFRVARELAEPE
jgi:formylglycine-generating enzyme required for sulfatase activity